jgi:hypothetical protein
MIATIFHEGKGKYPDMITVSGNTLEEVKENTLKEINHRGWCDNDCWSQVYDTENRQAYSTNNEPKGD